MTTVSVLLGILRRPAQASAAIVAALASFVLLVWAFGDWRTAASSGAGVPMAPSTAWLFVLLSCGVVLHQCWPSERAVRAFALLGVFAAAAVGLLVLLGVDVPAERWLASTSDRVGNVPVGRMSPLTAAAFLSVAVAFFLELPPLASRWLCRQVAALLALGAMSIGMAVLVSYAAGAPMLYGGSIVPMALLTAVAFTLLGFGILVAAGPDTLPLLLLCTHAAPGSPSGSRQIRCGFLSVFLVLLVAMGAVGYFYFAQQVAASRRAAESQLSAIADLKVQQILAWRDERLGNAEQAMHGPFAAQHVEEFLADPTHTAQRSSLLAWLELIRDRSHGLRAVLLDPQMRLRLAFPEDRVSLGPIARSLASESLRSHRVSMSDLHRSRFSGEIHLDLAIPLSVGRSLPELGAVPAGIDKRPPIALILVEVDPHRYLYPRIQEWPTPSPTAETLLVRREGNEVVFLNELRHQSGTALALRLPIERRGLPAAEAALGCEGTIKGVDYRGVPVLAAVRAIPGTSWFIVAKVDQSEIYAPLRERGLVTLFLLVVSIVLAAVTLGLLARRRDNQWLRSQLASEREHRLILDSTDEGIVGLDAQGRHVFVNPAACRMLGYGAGELIGRYGHDIWHHRTSDGSPCASGDCPIHAALRGGTPCRSDQEVFWRKDGTSFPVECVVTPSLEKDRDVAQVLVFRDVSERRHAEERLNTLHVRRQGINELQRWLLTPAPLGEKLKRISDDVVRLFAADFCRIWLLRPGDLCESGCIHAAVQEGPHVCQHRDQCLHLLASSGRYTHVDGQVHRRVPFGCYKIGRVASGQDHRFLTNDVQNDPRVHSRSWARELGLVSFAGYQLRVPGGQILGVLALFAKAPIRAEEDAMLEGLSSTIAHVLQQAAAEEELRKSEHRHRVLFEQSCEALMTVGPPTWRFTSGNPAAVRMFRAKDEAEFTALGPWDVSPEKQPDGRASADKALEMIETAMREGSHFFEWTHRRLSGETFPATVLATRVDVDGQATVLATVRDVSEQRRFEEQQALTVQRMESLLALNQTRDQSPDVLVARIVEDAIRLTGSEIGYLAVLNEDESVMTMRYWSKAAHATCKVVDKPIVYPVEKTGLWGEAVRQRKPIVTNDYAAPNPHKRGTPEGHVPVIRHMNVPVFEGGKIVAVAGVGNKPTAYDESDVRQLQLLMDGWWQIVMRSRDQEALRAYAEVLKVNNKALEEFQIRAEAATQAKTSFLANMSHEIRTPMTAILGFTDILLDVLQDPKCVDVCQTIKRNGQHLLQLINDILDISKIEAGKIDVDQVAWPPRSIVADVVSLMHVRAAAKGLTLEEAYVGPLPETITTDPARLRQILINLVGNAVKFTDKGSVRIVTRLVGDAGEKPMLRLDVIDTGIGIDEAAIGRLFQPFSQVDGSATRKYEGTGLGLSICRQLARALGGDVSVRSELGKGSTFTLTVATGPLQGVRLVEYLKEHEPHKTQLDSPGERPCPRLSCRILLAEDIPDNQRLIGSILEDAGATLTVVGDGEEAVRTALAVRSEANREGAERPFDVILMDIQMPVLDGYEATRRLRREGYSGPIIALTAHAMRGDRQKCLDAGCDDHLAKPVDRQTLLARVAEWTSTRARPAAATAAAQTSGNSELIS